MMWSDFERNEQTAVTCSWKEKKYCSYYIDKIDTILSKNIYNNFQNLLLKKLLAQLDNQTDISSKFYLPADALWSLKTVGGVLTYTTGCWSVIILS